MSPHPEEHEDLAWEALGEAREVEVDPYFAKRVAREAADTRRSGFLSLLFGLPPKAIAGGVAAVLIAGTLAFVALRPGGEAPVASPLAEAPAGDDAIEHGVAALDYIDYVDELVATEDPNLLSDADIIALLLDDGSAALLF